MGYVDLIWHVAGFVAPALFLAGALPLAVRLFYGQGACRGRALKWQFALNFAVGCVVLLCGLALTGHDGQMLTYAALALGCAASQTWQARG